MIAKGYAREVTHFTFPTNTSNRDGKMDSQQQKAVRKKE